MRPVVALLPIAGAALFACAPLETYYKPGASLSVVAQETTACEVSALRDVPPSTLTRRLPPVFVPGTKTCDGAGTCKVTAGYYVPGGFESYDPNDGLRLRVERQCMANKGYAPVSFAQCPDSVANAAPAGVTTQLPELTEGSCVIRNRDGTIFIVNRS